MRDTLQSGEMKSSHLDAELVSCYCAFHQSTQNMVRSTSQHSTWCVPPVNAVHGAFHQSTLYMVRSTSQHSTWCIPPVNTVHGAFHQSTQYMVHSTSQHSTWCVPPVNTVHGAFHQSTQYMVVSWKAWLWGKRRGLEVSVKPSIASVWITSPDERLWSLCWEC